MEKNYVSDADFELLFKIAQQLKCMGFDLPNDCYDIIAIIERHHLDATMFSFPQDTYARFREAVLAGQYDNLDELPEDAQNMFYATMKDKPPVEKAGPFSINCDPAFMSFSSNADMQRYAGEKYNEFRNKIIKAKDDAKVE